MDLAVCSSEQKDKHNFNQVDLTYYCFSPSRHAIFRARLLLGVYILQSRRAAFNQRSVNPICLLCGIEYEDNIHFIFTCKNLQLTRAQFLELFEKLVHGWTCLSRVTHLQIILDYNRVSHLVSECDKHAIEKIASQMIYRLHTHRAELLTLTDTTVSNPKSS